MGPQGLRQRLLRKGGRRGEAGGGGGKKGKMRRQFPVEIESEPPSGGVGGAKGVRKAQGEEGAQEPSPVSKKREEASLRVESRCYYCIVLGAQWIGCCVSHVQAQLLWLTPF